VPGDLRDEQYAPSPIRRVVDGLGGLDILVNNAGFHIEQPGGLPDIDADQLRRTFETNVYGTSWLTQAALPHLSAGAYVFLASNDARYVSGEILGVTGGMPLA